MTDQPLPIVRTVAALREAVAGLRAQGRPVGMVPTMGALHDGHISLGRIGRERGAAMVYSIFVNPTQFAPHEDFGRYPRTETADAERLASAGVCDLIWAPNGHEMYPAGFATSIAVGGPSAALETDFRPHFFGGVAIVVAKLLLQVLPDFAVFGEKDYQQLQVIKRMVADLNIPVEVVPGPTQREADGLALSSRNAYLDAGQRKIAGQLNLVLKDVIARVRNGESIEHAAAFGFGELLAAGFDKVDYLEIRDAETLAHAEDRARPLRVLAAAKIGATRLIDNMAV
ncbi:MAG: pantoate--beta-alanine ligase [Alphaproteobacteria bacterium]|nr:pantoate--beta-alanine ligase [Alphaproteobacteria bacterium]